MAKIEFIESYIKHDGDDYEWSDNHGELIRCKNCRYRAEDNGNCYVSNFKRGLPCMIRFVGDLEYCSYAEKR